MKPMPRYTTLKASGRNRAFVARKDESAVRYFNAAQLGESSER